LKVTTVNGNTNGGVDYEELYSFGPPAAPH